MVRKIRDKDILLRREPTSSFAVGRMSDRDLPCLQLQRLLDYWKAKRAGGALPGRQHIDPLDLPDLLSNMMLIDVCRDTKPVQFRFRLCGTEIVRITGRDLTGMTLDEALPDGYRDYIRFLDELVISKKEPVFSRTLFHDKANFANAETSRILLPLAMDGETVDMILVYQLFRYMDQRDPSDTWDVRKPQTALINIDDIRLA
ncbi:PAS domain-containing protein [Oceanibaculum indicum]|uniref:PAS domain-containing protein n=1 Tax=Oceanibaculum indicum TaxID=526216 RepID=A0A420WHT2_9PROT|nr:PAS domain-containing protein [Oceanibaculum indicum]RKQ70558.1 PAS domain-containing protein [Oceanibaculum indicum]